MSSLQMMHESSNASSSSVVASGNRSFRLAVTLLYWMNALTRRLKFLNVM